MRCIDITYPDVNNGLGCRVTVWIAGCSHHCKGCQNMESWNYDIGMDMKCAKEKIYQYLEHDYIKGVTFSGGDPLSQTDTSLNELSQLIDDIRKDFPNKDIWMYTGYSLTECFRNPLKRAIIEKVDYLVDGEFKQNLRDTSLAFRGSSNQIIWENHNGVFIHSTLND